MTVDALWRRRGASPAHHSKFVPQPQFDGARADLCLSFNASHRPRTLASMASGYAYTNEGTLLPLKMSPVGRVLEFQGSGGGNYVQPARSFIGSYTLLAVFTGADEMVDGDTAYLYSHGTSYATNCVSLTKSSGAFTLNIIRSGVSQTLALGSFLPNAFAAVFRRDSVGSAFSAWIARRERADWAGVSTPNIEVVGNFYVFTKMAVNLVVAWQSALSTPACEALRKNPWRVFR